MDAYDIFKKLTRGAKFPKKTNIKPEKVSVNCIAFIYFIDL